MTTPLVRDQVVAPTAGSYRIDPVRSRIAFTTRHLFGLGAVHGTFELQDGVIRIAEPLEDSSAVATISAASFSTGNPSRDRTVRSSRFLDTAAHPRITFTADRLRTTTRYPTLVGRLVVRNRPGTVELQIDQVDQSGRELRARAHTRIDRYAFGVTRSPGFAARHLDIRLDVFATRM
jgi:polyisoprenoid-binding protein YceI